MNTPTAKRRVGFLVEGLGRSGGMSVVRRYAGHLAAQEGWESALIVTGRDADGVPSREEDVPVVALADADGPWDLLIATWWTTTEALWSLPASRRALFMQGIEPRFYRENDWPDRLAAMSVFDLPVDYIVVSEYMLALMRELRPDAELVHVPNGIDKTVFTPAGRERSDPGQPLRVLVEGQPTLWFKGIDAALRSVRAMQHSSTVTLAVHDSADAALVAMVPTPDQTVSVPDAAGMARLYNEHDVLLKLSCFEGFGLPVLEALHTGTPVITTPYTGHEALVEDGMNGLVVDFDDEPGTTAALDLIASDRALLARLADGAVESVRDWPNADETARRFEQAVAQLLARPSQPAEAALDGLMRWRRAATELAREAQRRHLVTLDHTRGEVEWHRNAYEQAKATAHEHRLVADARADELNDLGERMTALTDELEAIKATRTHRLAVSLQRVYRSVRPSR
jgi:hypothetical protein